MTNKEKLSQFAQTSRDLREKMAKLELEISQLNERYASWLNELGAPEKSTVIEITTFIANKVNA